MHRSQALIGFAFLLVCSMFPVRTQAGPVVIFNDRSAWLAAAATVPGAAVTPIDFTPLNVNGPGGYTELGSAVAGSMPLMQGPITFVAKGQITFPVDPNSPLSGLIQENYFTVYDAAFSGSNHALISQTSLGTNCSTGIYSGFGGTSNCRIEIDFGSGIYGFGINLDNVDSDPGAPFSIVLGAQTFSKTIPLGSTAFFGFISDDPETIMSITQGPLWGPFTVESPIFVQVSPIDEPATLPIVGSIICGLWLLGRRRQRAQA